jgi:hypothetical protein
MDSVSEPGIGRELKRHFTELTDSFRILRVTSPLSNEALFSHRQGAVY